jgi:hypothetical protein
MRRSILITSAGLALLAVALLPAAASAEHHGRHHHHRHALRHFGVSNPTAPASDSAGTITSFVDGTLTIKLNDGTSVAGTVTSATELKCESAVMVTTARTADHGDRGEEGPGENHGSDGQGGPGPSDESRAAGDDGNHDEGQACDMTALTQGAVVRDAELRLSSTGATFAEVEIVR